MKSTMTVMPQVVTIRDIVKGYVDNADAGVVGYNGKLNIRPAYQREFVYKDAQRNAVVDTIRRNLPLGLFYWAQNADGTYEVLDGQQRTISFCQYVKGAFSIPDKDGNPMYFHTLTPEEQEEILAYEIIVYTCQGTLRDRLEWFKRINIAGEKLTEQELRNINYTGKWLADAKEKFSKTNCVAFRKGQRFMKGTPIRQELLETALDWISNGNIEQYMADHCHDVNANHLWFYFTKVIDWVETTFDTDAHYRKEMRGLDWGRLYERYKDNAYDANALETRIHELMENEEVTDKRGIYEFVLSGEDESLARRLSKRTFSERDKRTAYEKQGGICPICGTRHEYEDMEGDHIVPWWRGGVTNFYNLQMLCRKCNNGKGGRMAK